MTKFLAIDGEAIPDRYNLLACSDGRHVLDMEELSTVACFEFLLSLHEKGQTIVCFGLNYDINMWIRDLNREALEHLWIEGECVHIPKGARELEEWFKLSWIPGHRFEIQRNNQSVKIYEVWGFFQSSFVKALENWGLEADAELEAMKGERGTFGAGEVQRVVDYCLSECQLLVALMVKLESACLEANIVPREWMGAGSLAGKLLTNHKWMKEAHKHDCDLGPPEAEDAILRAYFGGRVELLRQGIFKNVLTADIRSAYPYATSLLPSLTRLVYRKRYNPAEPHAIWHVKWSNQGSIVTPFPVRQKKAIFYPTSGEGWYHAIEVNTALELGFSLKVIEGWVLDASPDTPFAWIPQMFELRAQWKDEGRAAEKVLKLALNSMYGKLAQGVGYGAPAYPGGPVKPPAWQSYFWAGEVTARTRARMLDAAMSVGQHAIMISTDGLFHTNHYPDTPLIDQNQLGGWELDRYDELFACRAGVYLGEKGDERIVKSRGFFKPKWDKKNEEWAGGGVNFDELRERFEQEGVWAKYEYEAKRFIGIGSALMRKDFSVWRTWEKKPYSLSLMPTGKRVAPDGSFLPCDEVLPLSDAYIPKGRSDTIEERVQEQEQPMRS